MLFTTIFLLTLKEAVNGNGDQYVVIHTVVLESPVIISVAVSEFIQTLWCSTWTWKSLCCYLP